MGEEDPIISALIVEVETLSKANRELQEKVRVLKSSKEESSSISSKINRLETKNQQLLEELTEFKMINTKLTKDLRSGSKSAESFQVENANMKEALKKHIADKEEYDCQLAVKNSKLTELQAELDLLKFKNPEIDALPHEMEMLTVSSGETEKILEQLKEERINHQKEIEIIKEQAEDNINQLEEQLKDKLFRSTLRKQLDKEKELTAKLNKDIENLKNEKVNEKKNISQLSPLPDDIENIPQRRSRRSRK